MKQDEIWADIEGYEGWYQVSNWGRVRSLDRRSSGRRYKGRLRKINYAGDGSNSIELSYEGEKTRHTVTRLVWNAFRGEIPVGYAVGHISDDLNDDSLENLRLIHNDELLEEARYANHPNKDWSNDIDLTALQNEYHKLTIKELAAKYNTTFIAMSQFLFNHKIKKRRKVDEINAT